MQLGFLTSCFPKLSLQEIVKYAGGAGFTTLEVAAWPALGDRPFTATHISVEQFSEQQAQQVKNLFAEHSMTLSSIAFYDNNLHPDPKIRENVNSHLLKCIDAAALVGSPTVGTFVGRNPYKSVSENLKEAEEIFKPIVDKAGLLGIKVVIENCVMEGWHPDGYPGNLAYSPELWEWMFSLGLYLNYDPSHLVWMGIDPVAVISPYVDRIAHAQAKDIQIFPELRNRYGYPGKAISREDPWDVGWWRYRVPGRGQVDWSGVVDALYEGGYDGVISVEHEDPIWGGTEEKIKKGLKIAYQTIKPLIVG